MQASDNWVVARTKPSRERWAAENVARQGYEYYLPCIASQSRVNGRLSEARAVPLFASYLFIHAPDRWHSLLGTFGIASVLMAGPKPCFMPQQEIDKLRRLEDGNGVIALRSLLEVNKTQIKITDGPFQNHVGLYQGQDQKERVRVLLEFLGGKRPVLIEPHAYEVV
jgi:transcriptional antiterminator RfaH